MSNSEKQWKEFSSKETVDLLKKSIDKKSYRIITTFYANWNKEQTERKGNGFCKNYDIEIKLNDKWYEVCRVDLCKQVATGCCDNKSLKPYFKRAVDWHKYNKKNYPGAYICDDSLHFMVIDSYTDG